MFAQDVGGPRAPKDDSSSSKGSSNSTISSCRPTVVWCKSCGQLGHALTVCPDRKKAPPVQIHAMDADDASEANDEEIVIILTQHVEAAVPDTTTINKYFILLDSQSTVNLFSNPAHIANIHPTSNVGTLPHGYARSTPLLQIQTDRVTRPRIDIQGSVTSSAPLRHISIRSSTAATTCPAPIPSHYEKLIIRLGQLLPLAVFALVQ